MKLEVIQVIENKDGSATLELEIDAELSKVLIGKAITDILMEAVKKDLINLKDNINE